MANKQLSACPACGDTDQNWKTLQKLGSFVVAYGNARDWLRGVGGPKAPETVTSDTSIDAPSSRTWANAGCATPKDRTSKEELPPAVVGEVLDWLKEEVDSSWLDDCVAEVANPEVPETLELVDAGKKCTSVIGANGDYRSGMAREAVAYLLKNSMAASKAKEKKTLPKMPNGNSNNSTAAPSTVGSACPTQRSEKPETFTCPTQRSEKPEEPPESCHTVQPSEGGSSARTWHTSTPTGHSQPQSPCQKHAPTHCNDQEYPVEKPNAVTAETEEDAADSKVQGWSLANFAKGFESLALPMVPSWSTTVSHCSKMNIGHREVMEHGYLSEPSPAPPEMVQKPIDEMQNGDDWAVDHFAALETVGQSSKVSAAADEAATVDDECRSYVTSIIFPPVVPPLVFPKSEQDRCAPAIRTETLQTTSSMSTTTCNTPSSELEPKGSSEDVCPKGHDRRWHGWHCGICNKRGNGLRFGCVECLDANICIACKKTYEDQKQVPSVACAEPEAQKQVLSVVCPEVQPAQSLNTIAESTAVQAAQKCEDETPISNPAVKPKSSDRSARSASSSRKERGGASASKSVLSVQTMGTSSAAQLLGGIAQQNGSKPERPGGSSSKSVLSVQTMGNSSAAQLLGGLAQQQGSKPRSSSSKKAFESKSVVGAEGSTQRRSGQRAGGSVLSVKNASSSAAAGLLGPLLEQKAQR